MKIRTYQNGLLDVNSYLLTENNECIVIDPGSELPEMIVTIQEEQQNLKAVLLTHGHIDHLAGVAHFQKTFPETRVYIHKEDKKMAESLSMQSQILGLPKPENFTITNIVEKDISFALGGFNVEPILIGGHSKGSLCYRINDALFSGDTLFNLVIGRTDLLGSTSQDELIANIREKLYRKLDKNLKVYPGHGPSTTLAYEMKNNMMVRV